MGSSIFEAKTEVETYDSNKEKEKGTVIDAEYNNNNGDIHPIVESWALKEGIHCNNNIDTRVEPRDGGKLVPRNIHGVFRAAEGSIESTNEVTKRRTASPSSMAKDYHYTKFRHHMEHLFVHVMIRLTCDPQRTKLHVKVWDPGITRGDMLKQHLADKTTLGGRFNQLSHVSSPLLSKPVAGDGVTSIKRRRRDQSSDNVRIMATTSGRGRFKEDLESSTWRRRQDCKATPSR
nr:hypothetical protein [Tanacetum cinerariifolium]